MTEKGLFIVLEGIDGSGKSSQMTNIANYLLKLNKYNNVLLTREPYHIREIRDILRQENNPYSQAQNLAELFVEDRKKHIDELILPALNKGIYVISDRYKYSTIVYQSVQGISVQKLVDMHKDIIIPDIILIFDSPVEVVRERMSRDMRDEHKFESNIEFQKKLRQKYLELPKIFPDEKIIIIDGNKTIPEVEKEIIEIFKKESI